MRLRLDVTDLADALMSVARLAGVNIQAGGIKIESAFEKLRHAASRRTMSRIMAM